MSIPAQLQRHPLNKVVTRNAFLKAIQAVEPTRRRNGAMRWRVFRDLSEEGRFVERYIIAS